MVHEEESEPDVVENEVHPVAEPDSLFHRFPNWGEKFDETSGMEWREGEPGSPGFESRHTSKIILKRALGKVLRWLQS